jgi:uncharacterized protein YcfJ
MKIALSALLGVTFAINAVADDYFDTATVISAVPQTERVNTPRQECHTEIIRESAGYNNSSPAGAIIGGVAGGLLGNTIGKGGGRVASAAIGAGIGAVVGDRMANQSNGVIERPIDRCVTVDNWQTINRGYFVTYRYNGRDYTTVTNDMPGSTIRVRIGVNAADNAVYAAPAVNQVTYYPATQPATVVYREPMRVYAPSPVVVYGGWGGGYHRDFDDHGWGHHGFDHHRW